MMDLGREEWEGGADRKMTSLPLLDYPHFLSKEFLERIISRPIIQLSQRTRLDERAPAALTISHRTSLIPSRHLSLISELAKPLEPLF